MAKVRSNILVRGVSGKLGDQVVFRILRDGSTVVCLPPDFSKRKLSEKQKAHHEKFKDAAAYARDAAKHQPIYAELALGTIKNAYNIALSDKYHAPKIQRVELAGGSIRIHATDNVKVAGVKIIIRNEAGLVLEQGEAVSAEEPWWSYAPQIVLEGSFNLKIEACDLAGNVTTMSKDL